MALHITNPEADRLARLLAQKTGKGITQCLVDTLTDKLEQLDSASGEEGDKMKRARAAITRFRAPFQDDDGKERDGDGGWGFGNRW